MSRSFQIDGRFRFDPRRRTLMSDGQTVALPLRTARLLEILIEERHRTVPNAELCGRVWDDVSVTENSLHQAIGALRKALGDSRQNSRFVVTVPKVGYQFAGEVAVLEEETQKPAPRTGNRRIAFAVCTAALLGVVSLAAFWTGNLRVAIAIAPFSDGLGNGEHAWLADALREWTAASLGQKFEVRERASQVISGSYVVLPGDRIQIRIAIPGRAALEATGRLTDFAVLTADLLRDGSRGSGEALYAESLALWRRAEPLRAIPAFRRAVAANPAMAAAWSGLACVLGETGHIYEQRVLSQKASELSTEGLIQARQQASAGNWPAAIDGLTRAWARQPDQLDMTLELAWAQLGARQAAHARDTLAAAERTLGSASAGDGRLLLMKARVEGQFGDMETVRQLAANARVAARSQGMAWVEARAMLLESGAMLNLGRLEEARALRDEVRNRCRALNDLGCLTTVWRLEGNAALGSESRVEAMEAYRNALTMARRIGSGPERLHVLNGLGSALLADGDYAKAEAVYREALGSDLAAHRTDPAGWQNGLAEALLGAGRREEAARQASEAITLAEKAEDKFTAADGHLVLARAAGSWQHFERSIDLFEQIRNPEPLRRALLLYAMDRMERSGDPAEAKRLLNRAAALRTPAHGALLNAARARLNGK